MSGVLRVEVGVDCADPALLARFWAAAVDGEVVEVHGEPEVHDPLGHHPTIWFQQVPEGKAVKNRLHMDVWCSDEDAADRRGQDLIERGAAPVERFSDFWVLRDPEGNEFCLCWG